MNTTTQVTTPLQKAIAEFQIGAYSDHECAQHQYAFPQHFLGFQGHFPEYPVLPAVIQCCLGINASSLLCKKNLCLVGISKAKYKQQLIPDMAFEVRAVYKKNTQPEDLHFSIKITAETGLIASFHLQLIEKQPTNKGL